MTNAMTRTMNNMDLEIDVTSTDSNNISRLPVIVR